MLSKIYSTSVFGMNCELVEVEVDILNGLPSFTIVGLGDKAVLESRERVRSAIKNTGFKFPTSRITVNLAPANTKKIGVIYDLPIALGVLAASNQFDFSIDIKNTLFVGELALNGELRHINGILPMVIYAQNNNFQRIVLPQINAKEASLIQGIEIIAAKNLEDIISHFKNEKIIITTTTFNFQAIKPCFPPNLDFSQVKGQMPAKRALEISASGSHNILLCGAPGSGKTLMAKTFQTILPKITLEEALEVTKIYSIANKLPKNQALITQRPFRCVHHTASSVSIIGGGRIPMPGEISLSHKGVLFLDEILEHSQSTLETLRQPLEDKKIVVTRVNGSSEFPADFILLAAMNPCPCGYHNVPNTTKECTCSLTQIQRYQKKLSGPLLDRIDLYLDISPVKYEKLKNKDDEESSKKIRARVQKARDIQIKRFKKHKIFSNAQMSNKEIKEFCKIPKEAENLLKLAVSQINLSARGYHRVLKVARTIADLAGMKNIETIHIAEALQYRKKI